MHGPKNLLFLLACAPLVAALLLTTPRPAAADPADEETALVAAVRSAIADGRLTQSKNLGFGNSKGDFTESPTTPGVLIGFEVGVGKYFDNEVVYALRAVFRTANGDEVLKDHGLFRDKLTPKGKTLKTQVRRLVHIKAPAGYAVGAVTVRSGLLINGFSATFMRMKNGRLDPLDAVESDWIGDRKGGGETTVGDDGAPVAGIAGSQDEEHISALGLIFAEDPAPAAAPLVVRPPTDPPPAPPVVVQPPIPTRPPAPAPAPAVVEDPPALPPPAAPAPEQHDPPPAPPQEPAPAATTHASAPTPAEKPASDPVLTYVVPGGAFVAVTGLIGVFAFASFRRKTQAVQGPAARVAQPLHLPVAVPLPVTALRERPSARPVPPTDDDVVLELVPDDFDPNVPQIDHRAEAPKAVPPSSDDWPRLEI